MTQLFRGSTEELACTYPFHGALVAERCLAQQPAPMDWLDARGLALGRIDKGWLASR